MTKSKLGINDVKLIMWYFCSENIFSLSHRVLTETEIRVLKKGLNFDLIQRHVIGPELRNDFNEF